MSRSEQQETYNTAKSQNATNFANAQDSYKSAQTDIANYETELGKYAAANPYLSGGEYQKDINTGLSQVSDAGAASERAQLQAAARRTGQNMNSANAAAENISETNERNLSGQLAGAENERMAREAAYGQSVLGATAVPISAESSLYGTAGGQANSALSQQSELAKQPSFWDQLALAGLSGAAGIGAAYAGKKG